MRLFALRGATTVSRNNSEDILEATSELMQAIMDRNDLGPDRVVSCIFTATEELMRALIEENSLEPADLVSCIFTCTRDLDAEFPAVAARRLGFDRVPLLCAREINVPGSLSSVIRVLIHYHADEDHESRHVYLREASGLRVDLDAAQ